MADDAFALDTADAAVEMASLKEVEQQNDVHMDIEVMYGVLSLHVSTARIHAQ